MLHAMHYCMSKLVTFTPQSTALLRQVKVIPNENAPYFSSKLLNRQIKVAIHHLLKRAQERSLVGLEKEIKKRSKDSWSVAFCVLLILCLCAEDIQIAADTFVTHPEVGDEIHRSGSHKICMDLESLPYEQCSNLFHEVFGTFKRRNGHGGDGPFNPLKQESLSESYLSPASRELVSGIRDIIANHCK